MTSAPTGILGEVPTGTPLLGDDEPEAGDAGVEQVLGSRSSLLGQSTSLSLEVNCSLDQSSRCLATK